MIDDLINGNLKDAKQKAHDHNKLSIKRYLLDIGWSVDKSEKAATYLKTGNGWQDYCDAE